VLLDEDGEAIEAPFEPSVVVEENGPYVIRGGVRVESGDGHVWETRNRMTLCRCGQSGSKPFCDGSHMDAAFDGTETASRASYAERAVLAAVRSFDIWPGEAISWAAVHEAAVLRGYNAERLDHASETLRAKDCVRDLDQERITLTKQGFLAALQPAAA